MREAGSHQPLGQSSANGEFIPAPCPRCGYDMRGIVAAWSTQCPTQGTCSECGLVFDWCDLLNPDLTLPTDMFEHAHVARIVRAFVRTYTLTFRPTRFWKRLRMEHRIVWRRLCAQLIVLAIVMYIVFALSHGTAQFFNVHGPKVRGLTSNAPEMTSALLAAANPWSTQSPGALSGRTWAFAIESPRELLVRIWVDFSQTRGLLLWTACFMILTPLAFAALPVSRKRAKVRSAHVCRIAAYTFCLLLPMYAVWFGVVLLQLSDAGGTSIFRAWLTPDSLRWFLRLGLIVTLLGVLWWWRCASRYYLRMEHSWAVALSVVVIGFVGAWAASCLLDPGFTQEFVRRIVFRFYQ